MIDNNDFNDDEKIDINYYLSEFEDTGMSQRELARYLRREIGLSRKLALYIAGKCGKCVPSVSLPTKQRLSQKLLGRDIFFNR